MVRCLGWQFNFDYHLTLILVLWALGWSMITLSALVYLPTWLVATFGVVMIATHNLFDAVQSSNPLWVILHSPDFLINRPEHILFVTYVLVPWVGVTAAGYGLGQVFSSGWTPERRKTFLLRLGTGLTTAFVVIRAINIYGDPLRWSTQKSAAFTVLSFLNTTKYPPSLLYLLMTLGPAILFLRVVDGWDPTNPAANAGFRASSDVLLPVARAHNSHSRCHYLLRTLWPGTLDVRIDRP